MELSTVGTSQHKTEWAVQSIKDAQESIWVIDVSLLDNQEAILAKEKELARIESRIKEKFYPSAREGKDDQKMRQLELAGLQGNRERMLADRKRYEDQVVQVKHFMNIE